MPLYWTFTTSTAESRPTTLRKHMKDLQEQAKQGVDYKSYWVAEEEGKIFCLVEAPNAEAANIVRRDSHGLVADEIYEVKEGE